MTHNFSFYIETGPSHRLKSGNILETVQGQDVHCTDY